MPPATGGGMAVKHFTERVAWQLADELETEVIALVRATSAERDFKYRDELLEALSSVPANIAEWFTRKSPRDECRFFDIALASLSETQTRLNGGVKRRHFTREQLSPLLKLAHRTYRAAVGYKQHQLRYLHENTVRYGKRASTATPSLGPRRPTRSRS